MSEESRDALSGEQAAQDSISGEQGAQDNSISGEQAAQDSVSEELLDQVAGGMFDGAVTPAFNNKCPCRCAAPP